MSNPDGDDADGMAALILAAATDRTWAHKIAAQYTAIIGVHIVPLRAIVPDGYDGWRVKTAGGYHAEIWSMFVTWRLALVPVDDYIQASVPFWCYTRNGNGLAMAMANAALWNGNPDDWQPTGFHRAWP